MSAALPRGAAAAVAEAAFGPDGLLPAIVQDDVSGEVLMLGWMDAEALRRLNALPYHSPDDVNGQQTRKEERQL